MTETSRSRESVLTHGEQLPSDDSIFRRVPTADMLAIDQVTGKRRPSSSAFKPDSDGVSVYSQYAMSASCLVPGHLLRREGDTLVQVAVAELRSLDGVDAVGDPWPQDVTEADDLKHPRNAAHSLIVGFENRGKNARIRVQQELARLPSVILVEPDFDQNLVRRIEAHGETE